MRLSNTNKDLIMGALMERASRTMSETDGKDLPLFMDKTLEYLNYLRGLKRSEFTVKAVRSSLSLFVRYTMKVKAIPPHKFSLADCTDGFVRGWLSYEVEVNKISAATRNLRLMHLRGYLLYLSSKNPFAASVYIKLSEIGEMRIEQQQKTIMNEAQILAIVKIARAGRNGLRNAVMIFLAFECALRASELIALTVQDVILTEDRSFVHIFGKNKRLRDLVLSKDAVEVMRKYMQRVHSSSSPDTPLFFSLKKGKRQGLTVRSFEYILKACADEARETDQTIPRRVHPHALRRSRATQLYRDDTPIELVSQFLGHAQLATTTIYAIPSDEQLAEAAAKSDFGKEWLNAGNELDEDELQKLMTIAGLTP